MLSCAGCRWFNREKTSLWGVMYVCGHEKSYRESPGLGMAWHRLTVDMRAEDGACGPARVLYEVSDGQASD